MRFFAQANSSSSPSRPVTQVATTKSVVTSKAIGMVAAGTSMDHLPAGLIDLPIK
jgi:hypothetical protein